MDLYLLDSNFKQLRVIDVRNSLIWTERYDNQGEVDLRVASNADTKAYLTEGSFLGLTGSQEVMRVESVEDTAGEIIAIGYSLVGFFKQRMLRDRWQTDKDSWELTGTVGDICQQIVSDMCMPGGLMASGVVLPYPDCTYALISKLILGTSAYSPGQDIAISYGDVFAGLQSVIQPEGCGFRLYPIPDLTDGHHLVFDTYKGLDRTSTQHVNSVVIFEPSLDSLTNTDEIRSLENYKTAAYAWASGITDQDQIGIAYAPGTDEFTDFDRRVLLVDASDVNAADYTTTKLRSILNRKAANALANNNYVRTTDGQLVPQKAFSYGIDYNMGDIVELRGTNNVAQKARITEYIRSEDNTGETAYPTLSLI